MNIYIYLLSFCLTTNLISNSSPDGSLTYSELSKSDEDRMTLILMHLRETEQRQDPAEELFPFEEWMSELETGLNRYFHGCIYEENEISEIAQIVEAIVSRAYDRPDGDQPISDEGLNLQERFLRKLFMLPNKPGGPNQEELKRLAEIFTAIYCRTY